MFNYEMTKKQIGDEVEEIRFSDGCGNSLIITNNIGDGIISIDTIFETHVYETVIEDMPMKEFMELFGVTDYN